MKTKTIKIGGLYFKKEIQEILNKCPDDSCWIHVLQVRSLED